jgi:hypothetical protein
MHIKEIRSARRDMNVPPGPACNRGQLSICALATALDVSRINTTISRSAASVGCAVSIIQSNIS